MYSVPPAVPIKFTTRYTSATDIMLDISSMNNNDISTLTNIDKDVVSRSADTMADDRPVR